MKQKTSVLLLLGLILSAFVFQASQVRWGFFGHRRINRVAVFTLPTAMIPFYKKNIEYITEHAVDPDKRRYATVHEGVRHYIDLDKYIEKPPLRWEEAFAEYLELYAIGKEGDTTLVFSRNAMYKANKTWLAKPEHREKFHFFNGKGISEDAHTAWVGKHILSQYYRETWQVPCDTLRSLYGNEVPCESVYVVDSFSHHGILPYHLLHMHRRLTRAFQAGKASSILQLSAEIGHYIADAHVPLHTTVNYNGQLTGQTGIHAFWESRIPELFADARYNFFVGQAQYIKNPLEFYWEIVHESHQLVDSVLQMEKEVREAFPSDQQYCANERITGGPRVACPAFAEAYQASLSGMVERRMRAAILAIGSAWYSAWSDAGQPDLRRLKGTADDKGAESEKTGSPTQAIRPHQ